LRERILKGIRSKSVKKEWRGGHFQTGEKREKNDKDSDKKGGCYVFIKNSLKLANRALSYGDFGSEFSYGTLRNTMSKLISAEEILKLDGECPARFILREWASRPEYRFIKRNDKRGMAGKFDFLSYLERLSWSSVLAVHDLRLTFLVYQLHWLGSGWDYCKNSHSYSRLLDLSYPVKVQCYDTGVVLVSVQCSSKPFPLDFDGLISLSNLLGEVKATLKAVCIPDPSTWRIVQWHLNRDSEQHQGGGSDVYLTFRDFFGDSARFYYKHNLERYRAEVIQGPNRTVKEVFESIIDRDSAFHENVQGDSLHG
jgi:hypothetical protein